MEIFLLINMLACESERPEDVFGTARALSLLKNCHRHIVVIIILIAAPS